mgnify:CR=1 FL=1
MFISFMNTVQLVQSYETFKQIQSNLNPIIFSIQRSPLTNTINKITAIFSVVIIPNLNQRTCNWECSLTTVIRTAPMRSVDTVPGLGAVTRRVVLHRVVNVIARGARHVYRMAVHASSRCLRHALDTKKRKQW